MKRRIWPLVLSAVASALLLLFMVLGVTPQQLGTLSLLLGGGVGLVTAVSPSSRRPGVGLKINLRSGMSSAAQGDFKILFVSQKNTSGGTGTVDTVLYEGMADADAVATLAGVGGQAHLLAKRLFEEHPTARVDLALMAEASGVVATGTLTFNAGTPVTVAQTVELTIAGRVYTDVVWNAGETAIAIATKVVAKITAVTKDVPVVAANGGGTLAVATLTAKSKGTWGNDIKIKARLIDGVGGSVTPDNTSTAMTSGTTEPTNANVILLIAGREYRVIVQAMSNTDAAIASGTSNAGRLKTYIAATDNGIGALLETVVFAATDSTTNAKAMSNQHDFEYFSHHLWRGALSLPCEVAGAIAGVYAREFKDDPNHPLIQLELIATLYGSPATQTDGLTAAEAEDLLFSGVSYVGYTTGGTPRPRLERPISTYFEDADGNPDDRILDISKVYGMIAVGDDLRILAQRSFRGKKLMKTLPRGVTGVPENVVTEASAKTLLVGRLVSKWVADGVILGDRLQEVLDDGSLIIQVDPTDETQLDVFLPLRIVPPLVKTSIVIHQA